MITLDPRADEPLEAYLARLAETARRTRTTVSGSWDGREFIIDQHTDVLEVAELLKRPDPEDD